MVEVQELSTCREGGPCPRTECTRELFRDGGNGGSAENMLAVCFASFPNTVVQQRFWLCLSTIIFVSLSSWYVGDMSKTFVFLSCHSCAVSIHERACIFQNGFVEYWAWGRSWLEGMSKVQRLVSPWELVCRPDI